MLPHSFGSTVGRLLVFQTCSKLFSQHRENIYNEFVWHYLVLDDATMENIDATPSLGHDVMLCSIYYIVYRITVTKDFF